MDIIWSSIAGFIAGIVGTVVTQVYLRDVRNFWPDYRITITEGGYEKSQFLIRLFFKDSKSIFDTRCRIYFKINSKKFLVYDRNWKMSTDRQFPYGKYHLSTFLEHSSLKDVKLSSITAVFFKINVKTLSRTRFFLFNKRKYSANILLNLKDNIMTINPKKNKNIPNIVIKKIVK